MPVLPAGVGELVREVFDGVVERFAMGAPTELFLLPQIVLNWLVTVISSLRAVLVLLTFV